MKEFRVIIGLTLSWTPLILTSPGHGKWMKANLIISVLVVAVLYRRAKLRASSHCDQFSDILSTSSRSSSSTISSSRSGLAVPDKMDNISFHSEGQLRKSVSRNSCITSPYYSPSFLIRPGKVAAFHISLHYSIIMSCGLWVGGGWVYLPSTIRPILYSII